MEVFLDAAAAAGAPAVHLGVAALNESAQGFYKRLGFHPIDVPGTEGALFFGRSTSR
jgi:ribosomal protein S18 acetylase RimI-like enzyme